MGADSQVLITGEAMFWGQLSGEQLYWRDNYPGNNYPRGGQLSRGQLSRGQLSRAQLSCSPFSALFYYNKFMSVSLIEKLALSLEIVLGSCLKILSQFNG